MPRLPKCHFHNKRPSGAPSDMALGIRCTVLYIQNVVKFHAARVEVILFTAIRKIWPSCPNFHETGLLVDLLHRIALKSDTWAAVIL